MGEFQEYIVKDLPKAVDWYLRALKEHPEEGLPSRASQAPFTVGIWVPIKVAVCLQKMGRHEDAVKYYSHHYPWRMFWFEIAECYARAGNQKKAKEAYRKAGEYHLEDTWGSQPELAFRAFAALGDKEMMKKAVEAVGGKYAPSAAKATLWQMREWAKGARKKEAAGIAAEGLEKIAGAQ
jgi:tetratricopeptide (TPR) repeat protein